MRVGLDANLSPRLVDALNALYGNKQLSFERVGSSPDSVWLPEFSADGGSAFIAQDKRILSRPHEVVALANSGLHGFFLNYGKGGAKFPYIAAHVVFWWPAIKSAILANKYRVFRINRHMGDYSAMEVLEIDSSSSPLRVRAKKRSD
ncbi:MAG: hypothetical protein U9P68_00990 [Pseudomonadota bacterium]|nr:hypothetical protein [Pseudomonadota bacterium]